MRFCYSILCLLFLLVSCKPVDTIVELNPSEKTAISGENPSQDAVKNPYAKDDSIAIITNIGAHDFEIRIESNGVKVKRATIKPNETKYVDLLSGQQLYFYSQLKTAAKIRFKSIQKYF